MKEQSNNTLVAKFYYLSNYWFTLTNFTKKVMALKCHHRKKYKCSQHDFLVKNLLHVQIKKAVAVFIRRK